MVDVSNAIDKVYKIINNYIDMLHKHGYGISFILQSAMSILCEVKGHRNDISLIVDKPDGEKDADNKFNVFNTDDLIRDIRAICEDKVDDILPACADSIVSKFKAVEYSNFAQPSELSDLVLALVKKKGCKRIYNPFAGIASYALGDFIEKYYGQEYYHDAYELGKMRLYLHNIDYSNFTLSNSITNWDDHHVDCIVSTPPFGATINPAYMKIPNIKTAEEFLLSRFLSGNARYGFFVVSRGICFKNNGTTFNLRKEICDRNLLEMVINLPSGIFTSSGVSSSIIVLNKERTQNEAISFIDAENLCSLKNNREKVLAVDKILHAITSKDSDVTYRVHQLKLYDNDFSFDVTRYATQVLSVSEGQIIVPLKDILSLDKGQRCEFHTEKIDHVIESSDFVTNVIAFKDVEHDAWVNQPKIKFEGPHIAINLQGKLYVHKGNSHFYIGTALSNSVFKVNENIVDIEYLAYKLLESGLLDKVVSGAYIPRVNTNLLLSYKIVVDGDKEKQRRIISNIKRSFIESERKRLGVRKAGGDLSHMLRMPKSKIGNQINRLMSSSDLSDKDRQRVKVIEDNFNYMLRVINTIGADFSSLKFNPQKVSLEGMLKNYASSVVNMEFSNIYSLQVDICLDNDVTVSCDEDLINVLLDTAFLNIYRHAFNDKSSNNNKVLLACKAVEYDDKPYALITIANNGNPLIVSIDDYIANGVSYGETANTGLGGYHIYTISKKHGGYINLTSSLEWPFMLEVLLPIDFINDINLDQYENKCV